MATVGVKGLTRYSAKPVVVIFCKQKKYRRTSLSDDYNDPVIQTSITAVETCLTVVTCYSPSSSFMNCIDEHIYSD